MQNKIVIAAFVIGLLMTACGNTKPQVDETRDALTVVIEGPCIDSLLNGVVRASEMDLPMLWTDSIYDTCNTSLSSDGEYAVFIGRTEEDKVLGDQHLTQYGLADFEERNSVF